MSHLTYAEAIITGIVQGVSELFPISSLGHNVLIPALLGGQWAKDLNVTAEGSPYLAFVVALHVATAIAMIAYFWRDWVRIVRGLVSSVRERQVVTPDQRLAWMIILGTIPVGLVGLVLQKVVTSVFAKPVMTALFLAVNGLILLYSERQRQLRTAGPDGEIGDDDWDDGTRGRSARGGGRSGQRDFDDPDGGFWDDDRGGRRGRGRRQSDADDQRFDDDLFGSGPHFGQDPRYARDPRQGGDPRGGRGRHGRPDPDGYDRGGYDRGGYDRDGFGQGQPGGYPDDRSAPRAPGFQPAPGQPGAGQPGLGQPRPSQPGLGQPGPSQPGRAQRGPAHGHNDPSDDERTQIWNQQPGQQQWQGPDPRYDDPRYGQDPRDPRYGAGDDPRYGQEPPAAQGPAFTPAFTPAGPAPSGPSYDPPASSYEPPAPSFEPPAPSYEPPAPGFDPRGGQDPRFSPPDPRDARYPQGAPAAPPAGGPSFTPSGPGPRGAGPAPWEGGPGSRRRPGDFGGGDSPQTSVDVVNLKQYDESDPNVAADRRLATMSFKQAVLVGAWQIAALLPGISRDGIVTVGGMRTRLRREDAVRFSFLLSAPVLLAAGVLKLPDLTGPAGNGIMGQVILGSLLSFTGAYISVRFLTKYFSEAKSLKPFGYYCLAFGIISFLFLL